MSGGVKLISNQINTISILANTLVTSGRYLANLTLALQKMIQLHNINVVLI